MGDGARIGRYELCCRDRPAVQAWLSVRTGGGSGGDRGGSVERGGVIEAGVSPRRGPAGSGRRGDVTQVACAISEATLRAVLCSLNARRSRCRAQGQGIREIACRLGRAALTISRELRRNAATRGGGPQYRARPRSGMLSGWPDARRGRSLRPPRRRGRRAGALSGGRDPGGPAVVGRLWPGRAAGTGVGSTAGGPSRGARSKPLGACGSTSLVTRPCASATRRSIRRLRAGARGAAARVDGLPADRAGLRLPRAQPPGGQGLR